MLRSNNLKSQLKLLGPLLLKVYALLLLVLVGIGLLRVFFDVDIGELTRDPIHETGLHPFVGFLSNTGILLWCLTAAVCLFTAFVLRRSNDDADRVSFFLYGGLLTGWLMLDDLFLFHDVILREYLHVGEAITYSVYVFAVAFFFYHFRNLVKRTDYVIIFLALVFFAVSLLVDFVADRQVDIPGHYLFEDGFKFLGIASWMLFFTRTAFVDIMAATGARKARMTDGICPHCLSTKVQIVRNRVSVELPGVPLSGIHRYEKPVVTPLRNDHFSLTCEDCGYSEFYVTERTKLVSVAENQRKAS